MKKIISLSFLLLLALNSPGFAKERIIVQRDNSIDYEEEVYTTTNILLEHKGDLITSSDELPGDIREARQLFRTVCAGNTKYDSLVRKVTVTNKDFSITRDFQCYEQDSDTKAISTIQFVVTATRDGDLEDLQINKLSAKTISKSTDPHKLTLHDGGEMALAVAASTLASGVFARQIYDGAGDKLAHAVGGNLIAATTTLLAYYGLNLGKNQSALIGLGAAIVAGLLKEYAYDANHRRTHTVDVRDVHATALGGAIGAFFIRLNFVW